MSSRLYAICVFLLFTSYQTVAETSVDKLPLEYFASLPDVSDVNLSPDGEHIAYIVRVDVEETQGSLIQLLNIESGKKENLAFTDNSKYTIAGISWANSETILVAAKFPAVRYGTPVTETRLSRLNINEGVLQPLLPRSLYKKMKYIPNIQSNIIDYLPHDDEHILLSLAGFNTGGAVSAVKVNVKKNKRAKFIQKGYGDVEEWLTDYQGNVKIGIYRDDTRYTIKYKNDSKANYKELWSFEAFSAEAVWPLAFDLDPNILYVSALYQGKNAVYKVNLSEPNLSKELVYFDENYDVQGRVRRSQKTGEIVGLGNHFWHSSYKNFQTAIDRVLPDTTNHIIGLSDDENKYIVFATSDTEPGTYMYGDRKQKTLTALAYRYNKLSSEKLDEKQAISYTARDGLEIEGFLTLPSQYDDKSLPTIIFPHGGPISYDSDGFDYWTQFLSSRGYAVLQMNFRGSSGYGHDFMQQGLGSWGQAMQDDVEDGTRWLIKEGIADKDNICIVGASYGGYAALMGGVKTPDLYQCIVSFAGVSDVEYLVKSHRRFTNFDIVKKQIGDDYDKLWDYSPVKYAEDINTPVLLIHGSKDRVVRPHHSEEMYDALKSEKKPVKYIELEGGNHYLSNNAHRLKTFKEIETFLEAHLK